MTKVTARVVYGLGIGCHAEAVKAYQLAGADAELIHFRDLARQKSELKKQVQIINISGGFLHGDILGSAMCAANELEHDAGLLDFLWDFSEAGGIIYGQCNGFQLLVKSGLLPAIDGEYKQQVVSLTHNACGNYRVDYVPHKVNSNHFAFNKLAQVFYLWCRHGEGRIQFESKDSKVTKQQGEEALQKIEPHILLSYVNPETGEATESFPHNPNASKNGIAGLASANQRIFGHMGHAEVSVFDSRSPNWFYQKEQAKRTSAQCSPLPGQAIFSNIVSYFSN